MMRPAMPAPSPQAGTDAFTAALVERDMKTAPGRLSDDVIFFYSNQSTIVGQAAFAAQMRAS